MKTNDIANARKIDDGWEAVKKLYAKSGYIEAKLLPEPVFEEDSRQVQYRVAVTEGPQYRMGNLTISGVPQKVADHLKDRWRLKPGDVYDGSYLVDFVNKEVFPALRGGPRTPKVGVLAAPNREQHVMDVTVKVE